jgi:hypothetical protein
VRAHKEFDQKTCQFIRGDGVDAAVAQVFLEAMQPAQLEISLAALDQIDARARQIDRQWQLRLERAHYEAELARRRFCAVDPENRLVTRTLEREWNDKLAEVERLEHDYAAQPKLTACLATPEERQRILALAQDLPAIWQAATTTQAERKQLLRFLIKDVTLFKHETSIHIGIRWQTEALTELDIARPKKSADARRTDAAVVARIRDLAPSQADADIALSLNAEGLRSGLGGQFSTGKVQWIRHAYAIPTGCPQAPGLCPTGQRTDGRYSTRAAADLLNVNVSTIASWCESGQLDSIRSQPHGPRWIALAPETIAQLRKPERQRWINRASK